MNCACCTTEIAAGSAVGGKYCARCSAPRPAPMPSEGTTLFDDVTTVMNLRDLPAPADPQPAPTLKKKAK